MQDWPWDSYRATSGQSDVPGFLTVDWILSQFDPDRVRAVRAYRQFVQEGKGVDVLEELRAAMFLGTEPFVKGLKPLLTEKPVGPEIRREECFAARPSLEELFSGISAAAVRNTWIHQAVRVCYWHSEKGETPWGYTARPSVSLRNVLARQRRIKAEGSSRKLSLKRKTEGSM